MTNIKGPKSALSDFLTKHKLKVKNVAKEEQQVRKKVIQKRAAFIKQQKEYKITHCKSLEDMCIEKILCNVDAHKHTDETLQAIAKYIARKRIANKYYFDYILSKTQSVFCFYDCANIKMYINKEQTCGEDNEQNSNMQYYKNLSALEMYFCGQLTQSELNCMLAETNRLESLTIHGAYLVSDMQLPKTVQNIDVTHCSRLNDTFVDRLNEFESIRTLKLSYCYGLTSEIQLTTKIEELYLCETFATTKSITSMRDANKLRKLSIKNCCNIFAANNNKEDMQKEIADFFGIFDSLTYLDVTGISTITSLTLQDTLEYLNVTNCFDFDTKSIANQKNMQELNVSRINNVDIDTILGMNNLQILNISWCEKLDDDTLQKIVQKLPMLHTVYVFGCFVLTENASLNAREVRQHIKIIGNPAETKYLTEYA